MDFSILRTMRESDEHPTYALHDAAGSSLLLADQTESPEPDSRRQIRLARPGGRLVATIDLPQPTTTPEENLRLDYAIIHEYAVYAIISVRRRPPSETEAHSAVYYTLEVEGETWLLLPHPEDEACYAFYDEVPAGLQTYDTLTELDLPPRIGKICRNGDEEVMNANLEPRRLVHTDLVVLALALLIDQSLETA